MALRKNISMVLIVGICAASAYAAKPEKTQGIAAAQLELQPLEAQIPAMAGYDLRSRRVTIEAGGTVAEHSHADRPGVVYVLEGSLVEHRGDVARVLNAGDSWTEAADTVHWMENVSDKPAVIIAVDLVVQE